MNAVEIEEAVSKLADEPFDAETFPYAFLEAFGNKETTINRLKSTGRSSTNKSDVPGGVLQRNNIHIKACSAGEVTETLSALRESQATSKYKVKFILATDGQTFEAENLLDGETVACEYSSFADHFGFFLQLAGISTVKQIRENAFDIRATSRLNRLYVEILKQNPKWDTDERREEMNHFMARLIFCFFAEDTNIFPKNSLFTHTVTQMSARDSSNTHEIISEIFRSMSTSNEERESKQIRRWANEFPYVNGGLFSGSVEVPRFSKIARSYFLHVGNLDWTKINPDIFGSMIQAVANDEERGDLGMHYTSVPNILKVLNPLFLDDLHKQLEEAGKNSRKLLNLRRRISHIRVFDPACGSGNFLVIAYKEMRKIESEINKRRKEATRHSDIPLTNFRGIEIRHFAAEVARLALIIAEYQCDVLYRGAKLALAEFLPLKKDNWITCGNALRIDWLSICPPTGTGVKLHANDLFSTPLEQAEIDFENEGGETYVCGNPPYLGSQDQTPAQKEDLRVAFKGEISSTNSVDYVSGWFIKASRYISTNVGEFAFVATNSINQGRQVALLWPAILKGNLEIRFAEPSFLWSNLATNKAAVIVSIIGVSVISNKKKFIYDAGHVQEVDFIGPYLVPNQKTVVKSSRKVLSDLSPMTNGSMPNDNGGLIFTVEQYWNLVSVNPAAKKFFRKFLGSSDSINGELRYCLWIEDNQAEEANSIPEIAERFSITKNHRLESSRPETNELSNIPYKFGERRHQPGRALLIPRHSSERRSYLPSILVNEQTVIGDSAIALYNFKMSDLSIYSSRLHLAWISTVCGKIKLDFRYSNTLGWNTFPVPTLTDQNKSDLTRCAEEILLAREHYFPATIADMYDPDRTNEEFPMVREAHERNDEILERIYIGRRFKNDTERLEKLFELYTKMAV